ncbi:MAG: hypothetical protein HYS12_12585 [Planctomycetes bacterium]|nr:hypothetical protein [Planctomycetota bacterium]
MPAPPSGAQPQLWTIDTGFVGEAFAWRHHLLAAGLDPDVERVGTIRAVSALGASAVYPIRSADLWLVSNLPALAPWRMELDRGIVLRDVAILPDPNLHRPLVGMQALIQSGLKLEIDFASQLLSLWVP